MAKYNVTHHCEHTVTYDMFGPENERAKRLDSMARYDCKSCRDAAEQARLVADSVELPVLTGSDKQIAWALKIRLEKLRSFDTAVHGKTPKIDFRGAMLAKTEAKWWIDHRDISFNPYDMQVCPTTKALFLELAGR